MIIAFMTVEFLKDCAHGRSAFYPKNFKKLA